MDKMHTNEFDVDINLVRQLIKEQFPNWSALSLRPVPSAGTDNALYRLGNDMTVRLPRIDWAVENIEKEFTWLPKIAPFLPVAVPTPIAQGIPSKNYPRPWSIYGWIDGSNPTVDKVPESLVRDLALFIQALHKIELPNGPSSNRGVPLKEKDKETREAIERLEGKIDTRTVTTLWEDALKIPDRSKPAVWIHGDLSPGNVLVKNGKLSGVIDFGSLGRGDPACDLIIAWNLLPSPMRKAFRTELGVDDATWERGRGWALSIALIQLPYYEHTNPTLANNARHVLRELIKEGENPVSFHFAPAKSSQRDLLHRWFEQKHIQEWMHGTGLQNTLDGLEKFFQGHSDTTYLIGYDGDIPFAFLITSPADKDTVTLDVFICDVTYLGKGLAAPMIREFLTSRFSHIKRVLIDPEATNRRALHVYEKVGFKIIGEFIATWHPVPHYQMELYMEDLLNF